MSEPLKITEPGVYFDMSFADYLNDPSLSASGIKNLLVAPETFWEGSKMNPDHERKDTAALTIGSAYHARILEGRDVFDAEYAIMPDKSDHPNAIDGSKALKDMCGELGLPKSGKVEELSKRIETADPTVKTWLGIVRDFEAANEGKAYLTREWGDRIEGRAQLLESIPEVAKAITGGYAEVSIFWRDPQTDVPMKARIDYLKARAQIDLKSFTNPNRMPVDVAIARAVANNRYHYQAVVHSEAVAQAKVLMRYGKYDLGHKTLNDEWLNTFLNTPNSVFVFLFLEKTDVPTIRLKEFPRYSAPNGPGSKTVSLAWETGYGAFRMGLNRYVDCMERFGPNTPWQEVPPLSRFCDEDFPLYMMD